MAQFIMSKPYREVRKWVAVNIDADCEYNGWGYRCDRIATERLANLWNAGDFSMDTPLPKFGLHRRSIRSTANWMVVDADAWYSEQDPKYGEYSP